MKLDPTYSFALERPADLVERPSYQATCPQEAFIVPLLKEEIDSLVARYLVPTQSKAKILDVGCGRQPFRGVFEAKGYQYLSLDTQQTPERSVDFICEMDKLLPSEILEQAPFEAIFCTEVLEHIADWDMTFRNFSHLLAPGGKLLITCPQFYPMHEEPYDFWRPTLYALQYFGDKFSLNMVSRKKAGDTWDVLGTLLGSS
jgi:2-polyprenyl-3-methyl-5-hydroxy-6-metoxy-1,4-benzoquinol methylase